MPSQTHAILWLVLGVAAPWRSTLASDTTSPSESIRHKCRMWERMSDSTAAWPELHPEDKTSLLRQTIQADLRFISWVDERYQVGPLFTQEGRILSERLQPTDYAKLAGVVQLLTASEAAALAKLMQKGGPGVMDPTQVAARYTGRKNTARRVVRDGVLSGLLYARIQHMNTSDGSPFLHQMPFGSKIVGPNADMRFTITAAPNGEHVKHVDTQEDNRDYLDDVSAQPVRVSQTTVQCYLNPDQYEGGEFVLFPARLNQNPGTANATRLYEVAPGSNVHIVGVKVRLQAGQCVVFPQMHDNLYHAGAPVIKGEKRALRFVLDVQKEEGRNPVPTNGYPKPMFGDGFVDDRTSISKYRTN